VNHEHFIKSSREINVNREKKHVWSIVCACFYLFAFDFGKITVTYKENASYKSSTLGFQIEQTLTNMLIYRNNCGYELASTSSTKSLY